MIQFIIYNIQPIHKLVVSNFFTMKNYGYKNM